MSVRPVAALIAALLCAVTLPAAAHVVVAAGDATTFATATARSNLGTVTVAVSPNTPTTGKLSVTIVVQKLTYTFQIPSHDFTQTSTSATLDTGHDLGKYGSIHLVWKKVSSGSPSGLTGCATGGSGGTVIVFTQGTGTARLNLPCAKTLSAHFGSSAPSSGRLPVAPAVGAYPGTIALMTTSLASDGELSLTLARSSDPSKRINVYGFVVKEVHDPAAAPLVNQSQAFHTTFPSARMQLSEDLSSASVDLKSGPTPIKGTTLQWQAIAAARAATVTGPDCSSKPGTGATRMTGVTGEVGVQTCTLTGRYEAHSDSTFGQLYSNTAQAQTPTPTNVVSSQPANGAQNVPTSLSGLSVTYSGSVNPQFAVALVQAGDNATTLENPTVDGTGRTLTFSLSDSLQPNTTYSVQVIARDTFDQPVTYTFTFTTGS